MRRFRYRRPEPEDRDLACLLVGKLMRAKDVASETGVGGVVSHDGRTIATLEVVHEIPNEWGFRHRTVFVHLASEARELVPIPWRG